MLEAARALVNSNPLENDVIFLFTDGEESGLFGAKVFAEEYPLMEQIGVVINIEARGSKGPALAYEFNENNGWIIRELNRAVPRLITGSIFYEIYKRMPNDSDFTMFRRAGLSGINIAFIDDYVNYHSMTDSPENLSLRSIQHHGDYIMATARHFGNLDLQHTQSDRCSYCQYYSDVLAAFSRAYRIISGYCTTFSAIDRWYFMFFITYLYGCKKKIMDRSNAGPGSFESRVSFFNKDKISSFIPGVPDFTKLRNVDSVVQHRRFKAEKKLFGRKVLLLVIHQSFGKIMQENAFVRNLRQSATGHCLTAG